LIPFNLAGSSGQGAGGNTSTQTYNVVIRERDAGNALLRESTLESLNPNLVLGTTGLPSEWTDPTGSWAKEILSLSTFMNAGLQTLATLFVSFTPLPQTMVIEIAEVGPVLAPPSVVVGAVEVCPLIEQQRYQLGLQVPTSQ